MRVRLLRGARVRATKRRKTRLLSSEFRHKSQDYDGGYWLKFTALLSGVSSHFEKAIAKWDEPAIAAVDSALNGILLKVSAHARACCGGDFDPIDVVDLGFATVCAPGVLLRHQALHFAEPVSFLGGDKIPLKACRQTEVAGSSDVRWISRSVDSAQVLWS